MLSYTAVHNKNKLVYESYIAAHIDNNLHTVVKHGAKNGAQVYTHVIRDRGSHLKVFFRTEGNELARLSQESLTGNSGEH